MSRPPSPLTMLLSRHTRRREFIAGLGAAAWPLGLRAQPAERVRRVGVLIGLAEHDAETRARLAAFRQGMQQRGWSEHRNLQIDYRWAGPEAERVKFYAAGLVRAQPGLILANTSPSVAALQRATHTIPMVFAGIADPVGQGFIVRLARPGGNITGFTGLEFSLGEKWVSFLKELAPGVTRIAYLFHPQIEPNYALWLKSVEAAAATLGVKTNAAPVRAPSDIENAISAIAVHPDGG